MSEFHFVRTRGDDGGVDVCDGPAIGLDLASVVKDGLPPWNIALEIVAGLCEILDIADEDDAVHGDVDPKFVFIDETGAISLEGFGIERKRCRAPEGTPKGGVTDLYGLGYVAYSLFCTHELPQLPDDDPDAHDDGVIDAVLLIDLAGVPEEMQGDIQWFVAKLMAFDREDRPTALEAWRTFIAFADATDGPNFATWCEQSLDGEGERRAEAEPPQPDEPTGEDEDLGGPVMQKGPLAKGAINFGDGSAAGGQATAFWSRDAMKAALDAEPADDEEDSRRPAAGGGAATAFWSKDQMQAMIQGTGEAPRPKRAAGEGDRRKRAQTEHSGRATPAPAAQSKPQPPPPTPVQRPAPKQQKAKAPPKQSPQQQPVISGPSAPPPQTYAAGPLPPEPAGGSKLGLVIGGVIILLLLAVIGGILLLGGGGVGVYFLTGESPPDVEAPTPKIEKPAPKKQVDTGLKTPTPKPKPKSGASPRPKSGPSPKSTPSPTPGVVPKPKSKPDPEPEPEPEPEPTTGPARVKLTSMGRGSVSCAGTNVPFDGPAAFTVDEYQLPATCLVTMEGKRGVFQVMGSGVITCNLDGNNVACDKTEVP